MRRETVSQAEAGAPCSVCLTMTSRKSDDFFLSFCTSCIAFILFLDQLSYQFSSFALIIQDFPKLMACSCTRKMWITNDVYIKRSIIIVMLFFISVIHMRLQWWMFIFKVAKMSNILGNHIQWNPFEQKVQTDWLKHFQQVVLSERFNKSLSLTSWIGHLLQVQHTHKYRDTPIHPLSLSSFCTKVIYSRSRENIFSFFPLLLCLSSHWFIVSWWTDSFLCRSWHCLLLNTTR